MPGMPPAPDGVAGLEPQPAAKRIANPTRALCVRTFIVVWPPHP
jgi:hypothetical protein